AAACTTTSCEPSSSSATTHETAPRLPSSRSSARVSATLRLEPAPRILPISGRSPSRLPSAAPISSPRMPGNLLRATATARMREAQGGELEFFWRRKLQNSTAEIADLSQHHAPLLDLFPRATERADLRLTESQIRFFQENGYLTGIP